MVKFIVPSCQGSLPAWSWPYEQRMSWSMGHSAQWWELWGSQALCLVSLSPPGEQWRYPRWFSSVATTERATRHYSIASWVLGMCFMPPGKASRKLQSMMPHMPGKTCLVTMTWCFLLDQIHVGLAQTDPLEPDAVFINSSEELFEKKFTSLFLLVWDTVCKW